MKKTLYILSIAGLLSSCGNNDEEIVNSSDLQPEKISVKIASFPKNTTLDHKLNYEFTYENGNLKKAFGKIVFTGGYEFFYQNESSVFSYNNNQVVIEHSEPADNGAKKEVYTMENGKPKKLELYDDTNFLFNKKDYSYETNKIIVHEKNSSWEYYTTYFFDSYKNLIKSEKLQKSANVDSKKTTTFYLDFDKAKNPYKKLSLLNNNFYEKSLSENNYRKITYIIQDLVNTQNPPGNGESTWTYSYDTNGQVVLNFQ